MALSIFGRGKRRLAETNKDQNLHSINEEEINNCRKTEDENADELQYLSTKAGFVTLKERIYNLSRKQQNENTKGSSAAAPKSTPQYATLGELFSSKFHTSSSKADEPLTKRPKIPVMKLSKDDWNVKFWEERLNIRRRLELNPNRIRDRPDKAHKLKEQIEVFNERIEDVAQKLEKVREGLPQDMKLYQLTLNKEPGRCAARESSHEWTDLLKQELAKGIHSSSKLRQQPPPSVVRSPLGRPIGRISVDDGDD